MKTEIDTIKIVMSKEEAQEFGEQMNSLFNHFTNAVNEVGSTSVEQLMLDYPTVSKFFEMLKVYNRDSDPENLPW